ncbi:MAG: hypothetical protein WD824_07380 [Cyclobacteriaceae bacterium]
MQDTTPEIRKKQFEIIFSKTEAERLMMGLEMMEDMRSMVIQNINAANPGISDTDSKIEFVKRYYSRDFTPMQLESIAEWFKNKQ